MTAALTRRAQELAALRAPFTTATVVRVQHPTSVQPGSVALVLGDGTIEGFVGGVCAEHSVRVYSLQTMQTGEPLLLRILPDTGVPLDADAAPPEADTSSPEAGASPDAGAPSPAGEDGAVTVSNPCLSGGAIEVFLEPVLPAPRVLVVGDTPIAAALQSLGATLGLEIVASRDRPDGILEPSGGDLALVVAAHGRDEHRALRRGVEAGVPYIGLVASAKRGAAALEELRQDGVAQEHLAAIDTPAGIELGARTAPEIALSILARIVTVRRRGWTPTTAGTGPQAGHVSTRTGAAAGARTDAAAALAATAVDPICGMTIVVAPDTPSVTRASETVYFCGAGCQSQFEAQPEHVVVPG
ncbi:MAG: XdhC family protein [Solirubrobacteraceae bacterium]